MACKINATGLHLELFFILVTISVFGYHIQSFSLQPPCFMKQRTGFNVRPATSSSDLKQDPPKKYPSTSVVSRLAKAAARASKAAPKEKEQINSNAQEHLGSLHDLTKAIDRQLGNKESVRFGVSQPARDSMTAVVTHNEKEESKLSSNPVVWMVAIVFSKPLKDDQITVEYANRIRCLVRALQDDGYRPAMIVFVGGQSSGNLLRDADVGYTFFKHLCACQQVPPHAIPEKIYLDYSSSDQEALQSITQYIQASCMQEWRETVEGLSPASRRPKNRLCIHFTLVSSEYHVCRLNDIHHRSPGQSALQALERTWSRNLVETSWSYIYSTTLTKSTSDPVHAFAAKFYKTAQELLPVVKNLQGVVNQLEFFQRDNYRVLVSARRSLVTDMEELYKKQPSLRAVKRVFSDSKPMDVVLEEALLSLGRCLDVVRPAGLLTGSVSTKDWKLALAVLERAVHLILMACDPDLQLRPQEWGTMGNLDRRTREIHPDGVEDNDFDDGLEE